MDQTILLITYKRLDITELEAENIVGDGYRAVDAVAALAGGKTMEPGIIYHFNGMGSSALIPPPESKKYTIKLALREETLRFSLIRTPTFATARPLLLIETSPFSQSKLSCHPDVLSVCPCKPKAYPARVEAGSPDTGDSPPPTLEAEWNLAMIRANGRFAREYSGKGSRIALLDTGIAYHKDLAVKGGVSFCEGDADFRSDPFGHGTHCAGIVAGRQGGIARDADLFSIKVADKKEGATPIAILAGMGWALRKRMNVVSISLAGAADRKLMPAFANAVQALMAGHCLVVASTGDEHKDVGFPANTAGVIAVGGCDRQRMILDRTGIGGKGNHLTVVAPGQDITTTFHKNDGYMKTFSGSSAAAPHVAGLAALIHEKFRGVTPLQVTSRILASAQPVNIGPNQKDVLGGAMLIDCDKALSS